MMRWLVSGLLVILWAHLGSADERMPVAAVSPELASDPGYTEYARLLIQIDLLASPATARLPISVESPQPGVLRIRGAVPSAPIRQYLLDNARRISGLVVRDTMEIRPAEPDVLSLIRLGDLANDSRQTIAAFFPELADGIEVSVGGDGVVVLTGRVNSYETKWMLSQAIQSQPGCAGVINLVEVPADPVSGRVRIRERPLLELAADRLPVVPPAQAMEPPPPPQAVAAMRPAADDAPPQDPREQQARDWIRQALASEPDLASQSIEVDAVGHTVYLRGHLADRKEVEQAVALASDAPGIRKVVAHCRPVSIQRNLPGPAPQVRRSEEESSGDLLGALRRPFRKPADRPSDWSDSWRFRQTIQRTLRRNCEGRVDDLVVRKRAERLSITGRVSSLRDRTFVLKEVDNLVELRGIPYEVVLEFETP